MLRVMKNASYGMMLLGASYTAVHFKCKKQREDSMNEELIQAKKDTTRPQNVYYGINWGYRSDETIEKSLDTGDLLFFTYYCQNSFSPTEIAMCFKQRYVDGVAENEAQNVAFCFRTPQRLLVVYSDLAGNI